MEHPEQSDYFAGLPYTTNPLEALRAAHDPSHTKELEFLTSYLEPDQKLAAYEVVKQVLTMESPELYAHAEWLDSTDDNMAAIVRDLEGSPEGGIIREYEEALSAEEKPNANEDDPRNPLASPLFTLQVGVALRLYGIDHVSGWGAVNIGSVEEQAVSRTAYYQGCKYTLMILHRASLALACGNIIAKGVDQARAIVEERANELIKDALETQAVIEAITDESVQISRRCSAIGAALLNASREEGLDITEKKRLTDLAIEVVQLGLDTLRATSRYLEAKRSARGRPSETEDPPQE